MQKTSLESLKSLHLPEKKFMVMGSGILEALGIRAAGDIDLVVDEELFRTLDVTDGWTHEVASNGANRLANGSFQVYDRWFDEQETKRLPELLPDAQWVEGVAFNSLQKLIIYKTRRGQPKDIQDLQLINDYLSR